MVIMFKTSKFMLAVVMTAALAACGGGSDSGPQQTLTTTTNVRQPLTAAIAPAVINTPFSFASGVPDFGTTTPTTVAFTSTAGSPAFAIASGASTATGRSSFGSCIFGPAVGNFPANSPLAVPRVVTIQTCNLFVGTAGGAADGSSTQRNVSLVLGNIISTPVLLPVIINPDGSVVVNNITVGNVPVVAVTGS